MKYTVANDELGLEGKQGLYCFFPFEKLDKNNKGVFKIGLTSSQYYKRIEQYHTYLPMGVYIISVLIAQPMEDKKEQSKIIRNMEKDLMEELLRIGSKQIVTTTRIKQTEWFYTSPHLIFNAFSYVQEKYPKSKLLDYHSQDINTIGNKNLAAKNTYIGQIAYKYI